MRITIRLSAVGVVVSGVTSGGLDEAHAEASKNQSDRDIAPENGSRRAIIQERSLVLARCETQRRVTAYTVPLLVFPACARSFSQ
jgi:hypothetical protein